MTSSVWTRFLPSRDDRSSAVAQVACSGAVHPTDALSLVLSALSRGGNPIVDALSITVRTFNSEVGYVWATTSDAVLAFALELTHFMMWAATWPFRKLPSAARFAGRQLGHASDNMAIATVSAYKFARQHANHTMAVASASAARFARRQLGHANHNMAVASASAARLAGRASRAVTNASASAAKFASRQLERASHTIAVASASACTAVLELGGKTREIGSSVQVTFGRASHTVADASASAARFASRQLERASATTAVASASAVSAIQKLGGQLDDMKREIGSSFQASLKRAARRSHDELPAVQISDDDDHWPMRPVMIVAFLFAVLSLMLLLWLMRLSKRSMGLSQNEGEGAQQANRSPAVVVTSSYLQRGALQPALDLPREQIISLFEEDVLSAPREALPPHVMLHEQNPRTLGAAKVRVLQWNLNGLLGARTHAWGTDKTCHDAAVIARFLLSTCADVLLLQETANTSNNRPKLRNCPEAAKQMALLDKALRDEGFLLMRTPVKTGGDNPALIASRCALLDGGSCALDGEFQATVVQADGETRSARYVELPLGPTADAPTLGLIVTQLHHRNHHSGDPSRGLRAAEVACALEACRTRAHLAAQSSPRLGVLFATDFSEVRRSEYSASEWHFLTTKGHMCSNARGDDGVHGPSGLLEKAGFAHVNDLPGVERGSFHQQNGAPRFSHWTGVTVDHAYMQTERRHDGTARVRVARVQTMPVLLLDHLPIIIDLTIEL